MRYRKLFKNIVKNAGEIKILRYCYLELAHIIGLLAEAAQGVNYIRAAKAPGVIPFVITVENILSSTVFVSQCFCFHASAVRFCTPCRILRRMWDKF